MKPSLSFFSAATRAPSSCVVRIRRLPSRPCGTHRRPARSVPAGIQPLHIEHVELERGLAERVDPFRCVLLARAIELMSLPHPRPRQRPIEESLDEDGDMRATTLCALDEALHAAHRVLATARGVVVGVGGALAGLFARVRLDQLAADVDPNQGAVSSH
jgi:hypothetical protein